MRSEELHLSDEDLILLADGELPAGQISRVNSHLAACWTCRVRKQELEQAISHFVHTYRSDLDSQLPPIAPAKALLKARLRTFAEIQPRRLTAWFNVLPRHKSVRVALAVASVLLMSLTVHRFWAAHYSTNIYAVPNRSFTPGAILLLNREEVCKEPDTKDKAVPKVVQWKVFREYGVSQAGVETYVVDYLIAPALGGSDDIHNLWPQPDTNAVWNSRVKDKLEDHLRHDVCQGELDLTTAQREIAGNWIEAYKKYFHTDHPLE
jgi:hypothetical protein